jgi:hypothetical protein
VDRLSAALRLCGVDLGGIVIEQNLGMHETRPALDTVPMSFDHMSSNVPGCSTPRIRA